MKVRWNLNFTMNLLDKFLTSFLKSGLYNYFLKNDFIYWGHLLFPKYNLPYVWKNLLIVSKVLLYLGIVHISYSSSVKVFNSSMYFSTDVKYQTVSSTENNWQFSLVLSRRVALTNVCPGLLRRYGSIKCPFADSKLSS